MRITIIASGLVAAVALTMPALAEESSEAARFHHYMWQRFDTDDDGVISHKEFDARRQALFAEADANHDGKLNIDELKAYQDLRRQARLEARFKALDADGDGSISAAELAQPAERMWTRLDTDEDGAVTPDDMRHRHGDRHRWHHRR